eukprot:SAG11_NODE_18706_length_483_cov_1.244792_1_plen_46_part_10
MTITATVNTIYSFLLLQILSFSCFIFDYAGRYSGYNTSRHEVSSKN